VNFNGQDAQIAQSGQVTGDVIASMKSCPSRNYLIVRQHGVSISDYMDDTTAPALASLMTEGVNAVKSRATVPEVVGSVDADRISSHLQSACGAEVRKLDYTEYIDSGAGFLPPSMTKEDTPPQVIDFTLPVPTLQSRKGHLQFYGETDNNQTML
jgi:hypothetical protein